MKEKKVLKIKKGFIISLILFAFLILLTEFAFAADVAYIYKSKPKVDDNILGVFSELNLSVELINEKNLPKNFSNYRFIFAGDERFRKTIPVNDYPSIIINYYFGKKWGLTDDDGISKLASTAPLEVIKDEKVIQVYTKARFDGISIPYYYLGSKDKTYKMKKVATPYMGDNYDFGDVISYSNSSDGKNKICFFGIVHSDYWTLDARKLFMDCVNFVSSKCSSDNECPGGYSGQTYCKDGNVYQEMINFKCKNSGTASSQCIKDILAQLIEKCEFGCENGKCLPQCRNDSNCEKDYYSENYCMNKSVYHDFHDFSCLGEKCVENIIPKSVEQCKDICINGTCFNITCYNDGNCDDSNKYTLDKCINSGTVQSYCTHENIVCILDSDCGVNGYSGESYCKNKSVYKDYATHQCRNKNTTQSYCDKSIEPKLLNECLMNEVCVNGKDDCFKINCTKKEDCNDNNIYTFDECNNHGTVNSYCTNTPVNCVTNNDCGLTGFTGNEFCSNDDVYKLYQNSTCVNPKTTMSYCEVSLTQTFLKDCGNDYCENYGQNYCKNNKVYHSRLCYEKACKEGICFSGNASLQEELIKTCEHGCKSGECSEECKIDNDCGNESYSEKYCLNESVVRNHLMPNCIKSECSIINTTEILEICSEGCYNGNCISKIHDVALIDFTNSTGGIKLEKDGIDIIDNPAKLNCNQQYKIWIDVKNKGDVSENITFNGNIDGLVFNHLPKNNLASEEHTAKYKIINITLSSGTYNITAEAVIAIDNNLSNNIAKRQIKVICSVCFDNDKDGYDTCNPCDDGDDGKPKDCDDNDAEVHPNAPEICNGKDDDCDGLIDEGGVCVIKCNNNSECNDDNLYTYDECNNPGTSNSYCTHTLINCVTNNDCGPTGFVEKEFCADDDVYKLYQNSTCVNPKTTMSYCEVSLTQTFLKDCGNDYCESYGEDYCKDNKVYHSRLCYEKGCVEGVCFNTYEKEEKLVKNCEYECSNGECSDETDNCDEPQEILNNIYTVINSANPSNIFQDRYSLNQAKTTAFCNSGDELLSGAGTAPSCDKKGDGMCNKITYFEINDLVSNGSKKGWMSKFDAGSVDAYYDTMMTEAICLKNLSFISKYFSIYTRTSGSFSDMYSLNQNKIVAYCDSGDKVIGGGGSAPSCDKESNPACGKNQIIAYNGKIVNGNKEGWKTAYSVDGGNDDTIQTIAICLKKTPLFDDYLKVYTITNDGLNSKNQDKRISKCNAGDIAISGGGNICTSSECNDINYFEGNYKIEGSHQGWYTAFDLIAEDPIFDTQSSSVTCLGLANESDGGKC